MPPIWLVYAGAAFGLIGAVTGITGAVIAVISYRRVKTLKALDLRLEVHRLRNDAHVAIVGLVDSFDTAVASRKAVASAIGKSGSGDMVKWQNQWDRDRKEIDDLSSQVPGTDVEYDGLSPKILEEKVVQLHRTKGWIDELTKQYESDIEWDNNQRNQLREDRRANPPDRRSSYNRD